MVDRAAGFGLACAATLLISPLAWGHYYMNLAPAIFFAALLTAWNGRVRSAWILAIAPAILIWIHYLFLHQVAPLGALGLGTTAWFTFLAAASLRSRTGGELEPLSIKTRKPFFQNKNRECLNFKN